MLIFVQSPFAIAALVLVIHYVVATEHWHENNKRKDQAKQNDQEYLKAGEFSFYLGHILGVASTAVYFLGFDG